ncbi:hypothetical protein GCM10009000_104550 [Halobacterium noricense]
MASPVQAQSESEDGIWENSNEAICTAGGPLYILISECNVEYGDVDGATAQQVQYDIYADGVMMQDQRRQTVKEKLSYVEQTQGIALAEAKLTIVKCMNNGNAQATCEDKGRQEVTKVFSEVQKSIYVSQNRQIQHWKTMQQQIDQTDNLAIGSVYQTSFDTVKFATVKTQLYSGETVEVTVGSAVYNYNYGDTFHVTPYYYNGNIDAPTSPNTVTGNSSVVNVKAPDDSGSTAIAVDGGTYETALTTLDDKYNAATTSVHKMANSIYSSYDPGEIQVQDIAGPLEMMVTSSTNNDPLSYRLKSAQAAGYAVAGDGKTVKVKADFNGDGTIASDETKSGVIYSDKGVFPENTVKTGTTYVHSSDSDSATVTITGSVTFISNPSDSAPQSYPLGNKKFTVVQVYDSEGNKTSSMTLQANNFATTDTAHLNEQISDLMDKMEELEDKYEANSGGGGGSGFSQDAIKNFLQNLGIGVAGGAMIVVVLAIMALFAYVKILTI